MKRREFIGLIGGAVAWPFPAPAQQPRKIPTVGILWHAGSREEEGILYDSMHAGFAALGYVAGKNVDFEHRDAVRSGRGLQRRPRGRGNPARGEQARNGF